MNKINKWAIKEYKSANYRIILVILELNTIIPNVIHTHALTSVASKNALIDAFYQDIEVLHKNYHHLKW